MATKGQKFKTFTNEERTEIVSKYMSGKYSYAILAKEYNISWKTVESMVRKYKKTGDYDNDEKLQKYRENIKKYGGFKKAGLQTAMKKINMYK